MEIKLRCAVFGLFCVPAKYTVAQFPSNPCPQLFQYQNYDGEWVGIAAIPIVSSEEIAKVVIFMAVTTKLPQDLAGSLNLFETEEMAIQDIRFGQSVKYLVRFPKPSRISFLPKLIQITVDERIVCSGAADWGLCNSVTSGTCPDSSNYNYYTQHWSPSSMQFTTDTKALTEASITPNSKISQFDSEICGRIVYPQLFHLSLAPGSLLINAKGIIRGSLPWLVAVFVNSQIGPTFICSANLVSQKVVVTAASCFRQSQRSYSADDIVLDLGHYNLNQIDNLYELFKAQQLIIHSDYMSKDHTFDADLALVITKDRVQYTDYIRPICLWEESSGTLETLGTVYGYGHVQINNKTMAEQQKIDMPIVSQEECLTSNEIFREIISPRTFCAGKRDGSGPCYGNSGSGMMMERKGRLMLRGLVITSLTNDRYFTCDLKSYVVFTDVTKFVDWITSVINTV